MLSKLYGLSRRVCSPALAISHRRFNQQQTTHFGFEEVSEEEKAQRVYRVFANVASRYDLMNDAMSFGVHRVWKDCFVRTLNPTARMQLVDVAGGTGDIAMRFLKHVHAKERLHGVPEGKRAHVTVCDINEAMLEVGKERAIGAGIESGISWVRGDAEKLAFENDRFDAYTIAFGIRNCTHIEKVLQEAHRVLRPGGRFLCLEFSQVQNPILQRVYDSYSFEVIPVLGQLLASDWKSYQYLVESIRRFPTQDEFAELIRSVGFECVTYENLTNGVVAVHSGIKPLKDPF